jgi:SAM-dependent methyltransferase
MATPTSKEVLSPALAPKIAAYHLHPPSAVDIELFQAQHRITLLNLCGSTAIFPGARVLELGCGQGTCTAVLAEAVGRDGWVDAVDPGSPDYGSPFTLAQAQGHLSQNSEIGGRIAWRTGVQPLEFLKEAEGKGQTWDVAVLVHCIWYFKNPAALDELLGALKGRVKKIVIAEWSLDAREPRAVPHVLAAIARATLEAHRKDSTANIQTLMSPAGIKEATAKAGWAVQSEATMVPEEGVQDGLWEVGDVVSQGFLKKLGAAVIDDEKVKVLLRSTRTAVINAAERIGGYRKARAMDVWTAVLGDVSAA